MMAEAPRQRPDLSLKIRPQFHDDKALIEGYGDGGFRLLGRRFEGAILVAGHGIFPVATGELDALKPSDLTPLFDEAGNPLIDFLLLGCGKKSLLPSLALRTYLEAHGIGFDAMNTGAAARTYNVLRLEERRVAAFLLPVFDI